MENIKSIYNENYLLKYKNKDISFLKNLKKELKSYYSEKIKKSKNIKKRDLFMRSLGYVKQILEAPIKNAKERDEKINMINKKIEELLNMNIISYLYHIKKN